MEKTMSQNIFSIDTYYIQKKIHLSLLINIDQTGMILVSDGNKKIYKVKRSHQVPLHGKYKKWTFTTVLFVAATKEVLST